MTISRPDIRNLLEERILMFDVESEAELDAIAAIAQQMGVVAPVALRLKIGRAHV